MPPAQVEGNLGAAGNSRDLQRTCDSLIETARLLRSGHSADSAGSSRGLKDRHVPQRVTGQGRGWPPPREGGQRVPPGTYKLNLFRSTGLWGFLWRCRLTSSPWIRPTGGHRNLLSWPLNRPAQVVQAAAPAVPDGTVEVWLGSHLSCLLHICSTNCHSSRAHVLGNIFAIRRRCNHEDTDCPGSPVPLWRVRWRGGMSVVSKEFNTIPQCARP